MPTNFLPTCMGCLIQPGWLNVHVNRDILPFVVPPKQEGLTDEEKKVLSLLGDAWSSFVNLEGHSSDDLTEFRTAIHLAQKCIALKVARRIDQDVWTQP